ncbi:MAG: histidine phosphotransferase [Cohaesibacteraceae bacterium]|nr:histidine phosphotransferase [Cohaesibacteraceae bacterium]
MHVRDVPALDLAALLCSRVCHDIISPVGAISNGLEVLAEEDSEEMRTIAQELIVKSARNASAKLQFARLAFGAAGSAGAQIDIGDAQKVAFGYFESEKSELSWEAPRVLMGKNKVKLLLNLLMIAISTIPRGGKIDVLVEGEAETPLFTLKCQGRRARIPANVEALLSGQNEPTEIDAHAVQPYYAGALARDTGMEIKMVLIEELVTITAAIKT